MPHAKYDTLIPYYSVIHIIHTIYIHACIHTYTHSKTHTWVKMHGFMYACILVCTCRCITETVVQCCQKNIHTVLTTVTYRAVVHTRTPPSAPCNPAAIPCDSLPSQSLCVPSASPTESPSSGWVQGPPQSTCRRWFLLLQVQSLMQVYPT